MEITDDGLGGGDPSAGSGLAGLGGRVAALSGTLHLTDGRPDRTAPGGSMLRIVLAEDAVLLREGLSQLLTRAGARGRRHRCSLRVGACPSAAYRAHSCRPTCRTRSPRPCSGRITSTWSTARSTAIFSSPAVSRADTPRRRARSARLPPRIRGGGPPGTPRRRAGGYTRPRSRSSPPTQGHGRTDERRSAGLGWRADDSSTSGPRDRSRSH
jgi:hypothetical protein